MSCVCMVVYAYYPVDARVRREAEALVDRGDSVEVISLGHEEKKKIYSLNGVQITEVMAGRYRGSHPIFYVMNYFLFFIVSFFVLTLKHLKKRYQIVQVHTMPDFLVFVAAIPKLMGAKVILDIHDLMPELYQSKFGLRENHWLIKFITWIECRSVGFADRAIAVHKPHLDILIHHGNPGAKFIILLNLPDPKIFSIKTIPVKPQKNHGFNIIYHGTILKRYGLEVVIDSIAELKKGNSAIKFQIFGDGDNVQNLRDKIKKLNLEDSVDLNEGFIPMEELVPIILNADAGVVPVLHDNFTKYILPTKLLEYVVLGKPVICSRTETIEAYFDDSMVKYFTPGNVAELTEIIRLLYRNPEIREQLVINSDNFNRDYNWDQQKMVYYRMIDELIKPNSNGGLHR